jgi:hypothetical protein
VECAKASVVALYGLFHIAIERIIKIEKIPQEIYMKALDGLYNDKRKSSRTKMFAVYQQSLQLIRTEYGLLI